MVTPKRVVHITTVHHPFDPRIFHKECVSLSKAGHEVILLAPESENETQPKKTNVSHLPIRRYNSRWKRMFFGTIQAWKKAKKLEADIYHFHDPELLPIGWLLKKKKNVVIYDIHEDYVTSILQKDYLPTPVKKLIAKMYKLMEKFFTTHMQMCLAEKYYKDFYPNGIQILNYPILSDRFTTEYSERKLNTSKKGKLLYTGNVSHVRGALLHAKIPTIVDDICVHFVGKCPKDLAEEMFQVADNKREQLVIEGIDQYIEKEVIEDRYFNETWLAGLALFPPTDHYKRKELTKFFEYMGAGIPIICSDFPVWKDFIDTYKCGLTVDPYNDIEIRQTINYLRVHPQEAIEMGKNGKEAVENELNWQSQADKLINWYSHLTTKQ